MVGLAVAGGLLLLAAPSVAAPPTVVASFAYAPSSPLSGETVRFTSTSTVTGKNNTIIDYKWDLDGDGIFETATGTSDTASRAYPSPGSVTVSLLVTTSKGPTSVASAVVRIGNRPPVASFTYSPSPPVAGQPVTFTSTSRDPEGQISSLAWDLNGDGNYDNGAGPTVQRSFDRAGSYVVGLRVTDSGGDVAFSSRAITVVAPGSAQGGSGATPQSVGANSLAGWPLMSPFPVVRIAGLVTSSGTRVRLLRVAAPRGAKVSIRCTGRGCPFARQVRLAGRPKARAAKQVRVRRLERLLRPGVKIQVFVTRPNVIGKYTRFRIRRGKPPARVDRCVRPDSSRPVRCPAA
jgi:PKD repeat protein